MMKVVFVALACLFFMNCKHQISRIDYEIDNSSPNYKECNIDIKIFEQIPDSTAIKIGTIWLSDTGFSTNCDEAQAAITMRKEACALKADFINITSDKKPDEESNCYRCRADFYVYRK